jgi:chemotaxis protein MotA
VTTGLITLPHLFDPLALVLVVVGSLVVAALHGTGGDTLRAFRALGVLARSFDLAERRGELARLERLARRHGYLAIENEATGDAAIDRAVGAVVDGAPADQLATLLAAERIARRRRHAVAPAYWTAVADTAPALGMVGTVLGLVAMFSNMDDVTNVGPAMGLALLTTLYGAILSNLVAAPIAARLHRLATLEDEARAELEEELVALARPAPPASGAPRLRRKVAS